MCLGVPGEIISTSSFEDPILRTARVSFDGVVREVSLAGIPEASVGDFVIVHAGFALTLLDRAQAEEVIGYLRQMGEGMPAGAPGSATP
jgi:hydrogenase expression/formation protein HypC